MEANSEVRSDLGENNGDFFLEKQELEKATEAVKTLGVDTFITENKDLIYRKLEDCDMRVFRAQHGDRHWMERPECNIMFIADSLPIVTGIVHVGSTLQNLNDAKQWVKSKVPDADPISVLSALTLLYVAEHGYQNYQEDNTLIEGAEDLGENASRKEVWKRIYTRVQERFL